MKINRKFTKPGVDVFDTIEWTRRTSKISGAGGKVVFEMKDAEVPASWSQLATDIMVSKYFRKAGVPTDGGPNGIVAEGTEARRHEGTEERETTTGPERSARQVIHRLAGCWRHWGETHGYFDTAEDAQAFYDELCHMMLHQMCAPNSPQWFNTGLNWAYGINGPAQGHFYCDHLTGEVKRSEDAYTHPQPHACFIQSVQDDLVGEAGIMDLWTREARLFKYGSGTGTNFSAIRGEDEPLSGGGKSSGLMSFLKIGDRAAGAIKSGGTTRRAAKMVCLDLDHPDIESFVNWKVREEIKVAAMVEGLKHLGDDLQKTAADLGLVLDYDFNGEAYATVSGQNSNNSVRIPNAFFEAVREGGDFGLVRRTDGKLAKTVNARELWDEIGYAAWRCADPGVQYDTTINQWHTCPEAGRINASNPCVTGDTLVATSTGYRRIVDLVGDAAEVIDGEGKPAFVDRIFKTGHKPVFELKTRGGFRLKLTADHKVQTANRGDVPAVELTVDDHVMLERSGFGDAFVPEAFGELLGAAVGDGCITHQPSQDFLFVTLGDSEPQVAERLRANIDHCKQWLGGDDARGLRPTTVRQTATGLRVGTSVRPVLDELARYAVLDERSQHKRFTDDIFTLDRNSVASILRGLFTADGSVANYGSKSQYVALDSTSRELLGQVQLLLLGIGIKAKIYENRRAAGQATATLPDGRGGSADYPVQQLHSLRISRASRLLFEQHVGFLPESDKARKLADLNAGVVAYAERMTDRVATLQPLGSEDVYDLTEPRTSHFVANGLVVHNCSEYMFLDDTACNLASLNLLKFYNSKTREFDVEAYEHGIDLWTVVLEISVLMAQFPSREIAELSWKYRTLGLGYANLGAMLMQAGIPYDSDRARAICGCLTATLTGQSYATSAKLAAQLGPFAGYRKNKESGHMLRVIRNHRRAAYGTPRTDSGGRAADLGDYEALDIPPVPIDATRLTDGEDHLGVVANSDALLDSARSSWDEALELGEQHGYRNAQSTVIAPTGTIGLLMDCDTTGVEPDFALVKFKKLAGGGYFKIANQSLRPALEALGYDEEQVRDILTHVMGTLGLDVPTPGSDLSFAEWLTDKGFTRDDLQKVVDALPTVFELGFAFNPWTLGEGCMARLGLGDEAKDPSFNLLKALGLSTRQTAQLNAVICGTLTVEGASHLRDEHLAVFDCANTCGPTGKRFIHAHGHIRMMAAAQPFISGAISKTINLPHDATVQDIQDSYELSWELGLKANALYRDGCKLSQPLNTKSDEVSDEQDEDGIDAAIEEVTRDVVAAAASGEVRTVERIVERVVERPMRRRLPDTRHSRTHKFNVAGHEGYLTVGLYEDGTPGELFITMAKEGSTIGGLMDSLGTAISVALQYGVPVDSLVTKFSHQRFEPAGMTHNRDIPFAKSLVDYIFRWIGMEFVPGYREANAPQRPSETPAEVLVDTERPVADPSERGRMGRLTGQTEPSTRNEARDRPWGFTPPTAGAVKPATTQAEVSGGESAVGANEPSARLSGDRSSLTDAMGALQADAPACDVCGTITVRSGTCYKCLNCGASMGCS